MLKLPDIRTGLAVGLTTCSLVLGVQPVQASVPPTCKIAGSSDAALLLGRKPLLLTTANGCLFSVGTKDLLIGEFSGTKAVRNFRLLVNPKTRVVSHDVPPGATAPGSRHFTRIDGIAAW